VQSRTALRAASRSLLGGVSIEPDGAAPALARTVFRPARDPLAGIVAGLGLSLPPNATLDVAGSDLRPAGERGGVRAARAPRVLTFRVAEPLEEVLRFYADRGVAFERRVVRLEAPFPIVERQIARGRLELADGHEATLIVSRPGLDLAARDIVAATSLRIDVRD
jgi:hypothetical protein